jgi:hypothetical protein
MTPSRVHKLFFVTKRSRRSLSTRNKTDLGKQYRTSTYLNPRVYAAVDCSVGIFRFLDIAIFHIRSVLHCGTFPINPRFLMKEMKPKHFELKKCPTVIARNFQNVIVIC